MATGSDGPISPSHVIVETKSAGCGTGKRSNDALVDVIGELLGLTVGETVAARVLGSAEWIAPAVLAAWLAAAADVEGPAEGEPAVHALIASTMAGQASAAPRRPLVPADRITCKAYVPRTTARLRWGRREPELRREIQSSVVDGHADGAPLGEPACEGVAGEELIEDHGRGADDAGQRPER